MQTKTIAKRIKTKLEDWLLSITDEELRNDVKKNILVSGGSITSLFLNEEVNDFDIYIQDIDVLLRLTQYYTKPFDDITILDGRKKDILKREAESGGEELEVLHNSYCVSLRNLKEDQIKLYFKGAQGNKRVSNIDEEKKYAPLFFSPNAISLSDEIQIVIRFHGNAEQIHKTFDFIHATNYFTFKDGLVTNIPALESILTKQLKYQGSLYPVTSIIRAKKFINRGWHINAGELLKIMFQISQLNLSDPDVLEEQLIGVDVAYFDILIGALRNKYESDKDFKLSNEYFNTIVDKVFNEAE
jgi:hypothetical protein